MYFCNFSLQFCFEITSPDFLNDYVLAIETFWRFVCFKFCLNQPVRYPVLYFCKSILQSANEISHSSCVGRILLQLANEIIRRPMCLQFCVETSHWDILLFPGIFQFCVHWDILWVPGIFQFCTDTNNVVFWFLKLSILYWNQQLRYTVGSWDFQFCIETNYWNIL